MIYVLAFFLPPLALLLNGQIFASIFNAMFFVLFLVLGILFLSPWLWLIAPLHAIVAIAAAQRGSQASRTRRRHRAARPASGLPAVSKPSFRDVRRSREAKADGPGIHPQAQSPDFWIPGSLALAARRREPRNDRYLGNAPVRVSTMQQAEAQPENCRHFTSHQLCARCGRPAAAGIGRW